MRKNVMIVGLVLVLALAGVVGCGGGGGSDGSGDALSPEDTVRKSLEAMDDEDFDKSYSYWVVNEEQTEGLEAAKSMLEGASIEVSNIKTTLISENSNEAAVKVSYDIWFDMMGKSDKRSEEDSMHLVKVDGKWLIESVEEEE